MPDDLGPHVCLHRPALAARRLSRAEGKVRGQEQCSCSACRRDRKGGIWPAAVLCRRERHRLYPLRLGGGREGLGRMRRGRHRLRRQQGRGDSARSARPNSELAPVSFLGPENKPELFF